MASRSKPCKECGSETTVATLSPFGGQEGPITVTVHDMPAVVCARNHRRFLSAEFVAMLLDFAADPERIGRYPSAARRGLVKKHYHCSGCDAELPAVSARTSELVLDATLPNAAPFKIVVGIALQICERCGREQVRSSDELSDSVFKAMAHGFRAADVHADR